MRKPNLPNSARNHGGGGYGEIKNPASGSLTVTASVSNGASRHAMPSPAVSDFDYAALFYKDGELPENEKFEPGTKATDGDKLIFSFQRPDDTSGTFTLEVFAFKKGADAADEDTTNFSRENALLSGTKTGLEIDGETIAVNDPIALSISSTKPGTVNLKITVPDGCSLEIDDTTNFAVTGTSPNFTIEQNGDGISAGAYQVTFTVKKGGEIVNVFSEYINVINGLCTDTWNGLAKDEAKEITQGMISSTVYVRGIGGWYDNTLPYKDDESCKASDANSGSFLSPLATIQKAVDKIIAINDGESKYTILVDGTLKWDETTYIGTSGMADFTALDKELNLTIKSLSGTATLDGGARLDENGTAVTNGIEKRIIYAAPASGTLKLTLEKLAITGGNTGDNGGGIYVNGGALIVERCTISGNIASAAGGAIYISNSAEAKMTDDEIKGNKAARCGGVYVYGGRLEMKNCKVEGNIATSYYMGGIGVGMGGTVIMDGGTISRNEVRGIGGFDKYNQGGGVYVSSTCTFTMKGDATISGNILSENATNRYGSEVYVYAGTFEMEDGTISGGNATNGGGVYVSSANSNFTMSGGTISGCTATNQGGGVFVYSNGKFNMSGTAKITGCAATSTAVSAGGGGIFSNGEFNLKGGTIGGTTPAEANKACNGGGVYVSNGTFTMEGGTISGNNATADDATTTRGGGVYVNKGTFTMEGGKISGNKANYGGGVYDIYNGKFTMGGSASIPAGNDGKNDVYLFDNGLTISTITVAGTLTATTPVATITPSYTANSQILSAGDGVTLNGSICNQFAVTPKSDGTEWRVALDGASGVLIRKYALGDTGSGGGAVCYYDADGFTVNGKTCHYLECSKETIGYSSWCPCTSSGWCDVTTSSAVGAGYANTRAILEHPNHASATAANCAAKACAEYRTSTTTAGEWFLPISNEAFKIYKGVAITSSERIWMSTTYSSDDNSTAGYVRLQSSGANSDNSTKTNVFAVRAMRAF